MIVPRPSRIRYKIKAEAEKIRAEFQSNKIILKEGRVKVLFVAANPIDTARLRLDNEVRGIKEGLRRSSQRNRFELDQEWSVRWDDMRSHLLQHNPDVLHISGYGVKEGILLEDERGRARIISAAALNSLLAIFSEKIRLVIINVAYSEGVCKELAQNVDFVVGLRGVVPDKQANNFSAAFYEALAESNDIKVAFEHGQASIDVKGYQLFTFRKPSERYLISKIL